MALAIGFPAPGAVQASYALHTILVIGRQQQHLVATAAEDYIEDVEHITAEDAHVDRRGVREGGEIAVNMRHTAIARVNSVPG
jgi:hypothetical protein